MDPAPRRPPRRPGTYALLLALRDPASVHVGKLGAAVFNAPFYLYAGSAFGAGGLAGRLAHHLRPASRPHWHVDHLRSVATVEQVWTTLDARRLECAWSAAAGALRGSRPVPGFGASDCGCASHLVALPGLPRPATFRRHLRDLVPSCSRIHVLPGERAAEWLAGSS